MIKTSSIICIIIISLFIVIAYQSIHLWKSVLPQHLPQPAISIKRSTYNINQSCNNDSLTFERRTHCNHKTREPCYSTNKSLIVTFWQNKSSERWLSQNILSAFPLHSFDHIIFVHDNSSWHTHPGYKHFIWIHVQGQHRLWFMKRFLPPTIIKSYEFLWILDDDAKLDFNPLHYRCVIANLSIQLSSPGRLTGALSHSITKVDSNFINRIGRWTDFVETGPSAIASSSAWQCIYMYIDISTGTGWGLDMIWCNMIAERCLSPSESKKACAILDAFGIHHQSTGMASGADGAPELGLYTKPYGTWSTKQQNLGPLADDKKLLEFCSK